MLKFPLSLLLFFLLYGCRSNDIKKYVQDNTTTIRTIEPDSVDYSDLKAIGDAIGNARVVMLGEQDHGDAPTFLAKTRLIKYLHERKGFNVLAFESDFFALNEGWHNLIKQEDSIRRFLARNIFPLWTMCVQCEDLFYDYIPFTHKTTSPLQITGFDNQNNGIYSRKHLRSYLDTYLREKSIPFINSGYYNDFFLPFLDSTYSQVQMYHASHFSRLGRVMDSILTQLNIVDSNVFHNRVLLNLREFMSQAEWKNYLKSSVQIRDEQMAKNLNWLVKTKYPNEKIIVWAANYHILKGAEKGFSEEKLQVGTMGGYFTSDTSLERQTYILGFTSNKGMAGRLFTEPYAVQLPKKDGFESWIDSSHSYGFIDFKQYNYKYNTPDPFYMKGINGNNLGIWTNMFDGVFYIRDMFPCEQRKKEGSFAKSK